MRVVIVGAGVFGASLAWTLAGRGDEVVLVDQFEPGDRRATSGGETRLIRCGHGAETDYTAMARRAWALWRELDADVLTETGVCWFSHADDDWVAESEASLRELGIPAERWSVDDAAKRFPSLSVDDLSWVLYEPEAGVLQAQKAVRALVAQAQARGAELVRGRAKPHGDAVLVDGAALEGDRVVWSCGGWLSSLFPDVVEVRVALQELFFFAGGPAWRDVPSWIDPGHNMYGTPDLHGHGVKVACDDTGPALDPDAELPPASETGEKRARDYLAARFPALADAPLAGSTTCRYELSADTHFIVAPHPDHASVWLVGGGSGRGFKHGPALAERIVADWDGKAALPAHFGLAGRSLRGAGWRF
ncbi:FAD-dependent oxidoreductase [Solirubrobacter soli]|uniref:FAD-dependent oxidoreductase n=1 Tax=Solirubrobacter soli TaxID=363832 RepID=UPI0003FEAA72|nr:FAD-dependent oxidoreductase [Solirubrobacter soli]